MGHLVPDPPYVLFVESDQALRERVGQALRAGGFVPLLAEDGHDALDYMADTGKPVLVILDLDCPGLDLAKLLARFRADARWSRVPVVVTGSSAELPGHLQVSGILPRPIDIDRLVSLARESVARAR